MIEQYEELVDEISHTRPTIEYCAFGLAGESGSVLGEIKKEVRDGISRKKQIKEELGDVLYYFVKLAHCYGLTVPEIISHNTNKLTRLEKKMGVR